MALLVLRCVMELGIVGLPQSGKTVLFKALTGGKVERPAHSGGVLTPQMGVVQVPEPRLQELANIFQPRKLLYPTVKYLDLPAAPEDFGKGSGIGGQFLSHLSHTDALLLILRVFQDDRVPHIQGSVAPARDLAALNLELAFSDLTIIERRKQKIAESLKGARAGEREAYQREEALLDKVKVGLEGEVPLREQSLTIEEVRLLEGYRFLTAKPMVVVLNIDENQLPEVTALEEEYNTRYAGDRVRFIAICGKLEMELAQLDDEGAGEFRREMGVEEKALDRLVRLSYQLLGFISFFTVVSGDMRAWTVALGTSALKAAGKIHTDMERGFIRAEVVSFADLIKCGSLAEARRKGLLRLEGKDYLVQDGDIITFLFNV